MVARQPLRQFQSIPRHCFRFAQQSLMNARFDNLAWSLIRTPIEKPGRMVFCGLVHDHHLASRLHDFRQRLEVMLKTLFVVFALRIYSLRIMLSPKRLLLSGKLGPCDIGFVRCQPSYFNCRQCGVVHLQLIDQSPREPSVPVASTNTQSNIDALIEDVLMQRVTNYFDSRPLAVNIEERILCSVGSAIDQCDLLPLVKTNWF